MDVDDLRDLLSRVLGAEARNLAVGKRFEELAGWDSVVQMELIVGIERLAGRQLESSEIIAITSIETAIMVVRDGS